MPAPVSSGASIVDGTVYVGFGIFRAGGVAALGLPTGTATATATPMTPTEAPEATATGTGGPVETPTEEPVPTDTPTMGPTVTPVPPTNTPRPTHGSRDQDDSCAMVPVSRVEPMRSLILLIVPAALLWRRRRLSSRTG